MATAPVLSAPRGTTSCHGVGAHPSPALRPVSADLRGPRTVSLLQVATAVREPRPPIDKYGVEELTFNNYFRLTRAGKVTVINKRKLFRDHLELSTKFRGWLCNFCNVGKIPLLDARTTAEYKLYQGRLYVNCTTFPSP